MRWTIDKSRYVVTMTSLTTVGLPLEGSIEGLFRVFPSLLAMRLEVHRGSKSYGLVTPSDAFGGLLEGPFREVPSLVSVRLIVRLAVIRIRMSILHRHSPSPFIKCHLH